MKNFPGILLALLLSACGGGSDGNAAPPVSGDMWLPVTRAIEAAATQFPSGLAVEIATPGGVVYSHAIGNFSNASVVPLASAAKWVSATTILRLVDQGVITLDTKASSLLRDRDGMLWTGAMADISLRHLLSFTSGISGDVPSAENFSITLKEAVHRIYENQRAVALPPQSSFDYGNTHLRIAARMAEVATGKTWRQIFDEQLRLPFGWSAESIYSRGFPNPNPAGELWASGLEYMRFMMMQLRGGVDGSTRLISTAMLAEQRKEQFAPSTQIRASPYTVLGKSFHYGLGNWRECAQPAAPALCDAALLVSSTGSFGWAPWIEPEHGYAAIIMTQQSAGNFAPSELLKNQLAGLIPSILAQNPPVIRMVP